MVANHNDSSSVRDGQATALYRAEDAVPWGRPLPSLALVQEFVDQVTQTAAWRRGDDVPQIVVARDGRGRRHACSQRAWFGGEIRLPKWARHELIVLHELAHARIPRGEAAHGPRFAAEYLRLVRRHMPEEFGFALRESFEREGVRVAETPTSRQAEPRSRKVLQLVRELRALSEGTTSPHEAASAAAKAQALLLEHNLSLTDVEALDESTDPLVETKRSFAGTRRRIESWRHMLVQAVARSCLCEWMTNFYSEPGPRTFSFIGRQSNVEVATYSYECLERQVQSLAEAEKKSRQRQKRPVRGYIQNYCEGIVHTIQAKQLAGRQEFERTSETGRSVVVTRSTEAAQHRKSLYPHVTFTTFGHGLGNPSAYEAGQRDGNRVQLTHGLQDDGRAQAWIERTGQ